MTWGRHMLKILMLLLLVLVPGCMKGACTAHAHFVKKNKNQVELPVAVQWKKNPIIQVCETSPVTRDEVEMVLAEWEAHGAPKLKVVNSKCEEEMPASGYVQIDQWRPEWRSRIMGAYAVAIAWPQIPEAGLIMVPNGNMAVLRHEIGHIWLHGHANKPGHVICPYVDCIGDDWEGVKRAFRRGGY